MQAKFTNGSSQQHAVDFLFHPEYTLSVNKENHMLAYIEFKDQTKKPVDSVLKTLKDLYGMVVLSILTVNEDILGSVMVYTTKESFLEVSAFVELLNKNCCGEALFANDIKRCIPATTFNHMLVMTTQYVARYPVAFNPSDQSRYVCSGCRRGLENREYIHWLPCFHPVCISCFNTRRQQCSFCNLEVKAVTLDVGKEALKKEVISVVKGTRVVGIKGYGRW